MNPLSVIGWTVAIAVIIVVTIIVITIALALAVIVISGVVEAVEAAKARRKVQQ